MAKVKIEVEVEVEGKPNAKAGEFTFVSIKVPGQQLCMLPKDVPAPRRLANDLALAAGRKLTGEAAPPSEPSPEEVTKA